MQLFSAHTTQKMKFFVKDYIRKLEQIRIFLRIYSHLANKSALENLIFCAV